MGIFLALALIVLVVALLAAWIWLLVRIWRSSAIGSVLTFFFTIPALYFLVKNWGDEERDIRAPFFANLALWLLAGVGLALSLPAYQQYVIKAKQKNRQQVAVMQSNSEMDRWCREQNGAVYHPGLGTCVEGDSARNSGSAFQSDDMIEQLEEYFAQKGMPVEVSEIDESRPSGARLKNLPEFKQAMQFEFRGDGLMPTVAIIGECNSAASCSDLAVRMSRSDAPLATASNGRLLFIGFLMIGDTQKIEKAIEVFNRFRSQDARNL